MQAGGGLLREAIRGPGLVSLDAEPCPQMCSLFVECKLADQLRTSSSSPKGECKRAKAQHFLRKKQRLLLFPCHL